MTKIWTFYFYFSSNFILFIFLQNADLNESIKKIIWFILEKRLKEARILKFLPFIPNCSSLWVTHDISNPLPMVYPTPYPWYIAPPTHDILNPRPMVYRTPSFDKNEGVQNTITEIWPWGQNTIWYIDSGVQNIIWHGGKLSVKCYL